MAALFVASPAYSDADLRKHLAGPPVAVFTSAKRPEQIELCAADIIGESFLPVAYSDGNGGLLLFGFRGMMGAGTVRRVVSLLRIQSGTRVELRTNANEPDDKLATSLRACG
jgi:hypothetical protein